MHITELLDRADGTQISFEIVPPRPGQADKIMAVVEDLMQFDPPFIDVTSHAAEIKFRERPDGMWEQSLKRKRLETVGICAEIKKRHGVETVPHLLCHGFTRTQTEDVLRKLNDLGIHNVMALHGDDAGLLKKPPADAEVNQSALDLVHQIRAMNWGELRKDARSQKFCVGVAGYPEKHYKAPNLAWDIRFLKRKVDAGADYVTTQMFFCHGVYERFVARCTEAGITIPIIPGLKVLTRRKQLMFLPKRFFVEIPEELTDEVLEAREEHVEEIGIRWCVAQCEALLNAGAPCIHFYVMQRSDSVRCVVERLRKLL